MTHLEYAVTARSIKLHPHTGQPLRPMYVTKHGRVMWPILGASSDDPPALPEAPPAPAPEPAPAPTPVPDPDDGKGGKQAVLDDLAKERDKRQQIEGRLADFEKKQQDCRKVVLTPN